MKNSFVQQAGKLLVILACSMLCACTNSQNNGTAKDVNVTEFKQLMKNKTNAILLDVRTKKEVDLGNISGAQHIDFFADDFNAQLGKLDKSKPVLVYCASGGRSGKAMGRMKGMGFSEVYNLQGGYHAWSKANKK